jgi:hypothetical protein
VLHQNRGRPLDHHARSAVGIQGEVVEPDLSGDLAQKRLACPPPGHPVSLHTFVSTADRGILPQFGLPMQHEIRRRAQFDRCGQRGRPQCAVGTRPRCGRC